MFCSFTQMNKPDEPENLPPEVQMLLHVAKTNYTELMIQRQNVEYYKNLVDKDFVRYEFVELPLNLLTAPRRNDDHVI